MGFKKKTNEIAHAYIYIFLDLPSGWTVKNIEVVGQKNKPLSHSSCNTSCILVFLSSVVMDFEEDPAAAFLAREQDDLADLAEDTLGFSSAQAVSLCPSSSDVLEVTNILP